MRARSAFASAIVAPGFSRATPRNVNPVSEQPAALETQRHEDVGVGIDDAEAARHHADDLVRDRLHGDDPPQDVGVAAEAALPVAMTEHHGWCPARVLISGGEPAPQLRGHPERLQRAVAHGDRSHLFGLSDAGDRRRSGRPDADVLERAVPFRVRDVHRRRQAQAARDVGEAGRTGRAVPHGDEIVGIRIGQWLEQHAVQHRERGRVGANAERQREDGSDG